MQHVRHTHPQSSSPEGGDILATAPVALVIEDDPDITDLLELVLGQAGFSVLTAPNGAEGIALARAHGPVLATIDVSMPGMDGLEATRRIREFSDTYIVIISTRSEEQDILAGFDAGADDYVPKPIRPRELRARLAAVARRPVTPVDRDSPAPAWAPAAEDAQRSAFHRQVLAGAPIPPPPAGDLLVAVAEPGDDVEDTEEIGEPEDPGQDGREGMLALGMRFVGSWIEFRGLRINPARGLVVVDDRLVDLPQDHVDLLEALIYSGTRTRTARQLALGLRGQTEETATTTPLQDRRWVDAQMRSLLGRLGNDGPDGSAPSPRWIEERGNWRYRLVRPDVDEA